jgi:hypothetical protein
MYWIHCCEPECLVNLFLMRGVTIIFWNLGLCIDPATLSYIIDPASLKLQGSGSFLKLLQVPVLFWCCWNTSQNYITVCLWWCFIKQCLPSNTLCMSAGPQNVISVTEFSRSYCLLRSCCYSIALESDGMKKPPGHKPLQFFWQQHSSERMHSPDKYKCRSAHYKFQIQKRS